MKLLSFVKRRLFFYKKEVKSSCLLYTSFFFICFTLFGLAWSHLSYIYEVVPLSLNPQVLIYDVNDYTPEIKKQIERGYIERFVSGNRLCFSSEDENQVKSISNVEDATILESMSMHIDNQWKLNLDNLSKEKLKQLRLSKKIEFMTISVGYSPLPKKFASYYFLEDISLIQGEFPKDGSNEVLIPDMYALSFQEEFKDLIGKEIKFPIDIIGNNGEKIKENKYIISGIFHSNSITNVENPSEGHSIVFMGYEPTEAFSAGEIGEFYESGKLEYSKLNNATQKILSGVYESKESYIKAFGTGNSRMLIICNEGKVEEVIDQVSTLFPDYEPYWQGAYKSPENQAVYHDFIRGFAIAVTVISLIFSVSVYITKRRNAEIENKEHALLFSQGYSTFELIRIIFYEQVLLLGFSFLIAQILLVAAQKFILPHLNFYESLSFWTSRNIWLYVGFFVLTLCFNTLLTCFSIRKKRLIQYLK